MSGGRLQLLVAIAMLPVLHLAGRVDPDPVTVFAMRATGRGGAFVRAYETRADRLWCSFAAEGDTLVWPRGARLVLTLADSSQVESIEACAVTPEGEAIPLGQRATRLTENDVERRRFRRGPVCSVIFAAFPPTLDLSRVIAAQLENPR